MHVTQLFHFQTSTEYTCSQGCHLFEGLKVVGVECKLSHLQHVTCFF